MWGEGYYNNNKIFGIIKWVIQSAENTMLAS